jgi:hypothetical protein
MLLSDDEETMLESLARAEGGISHSEAMRRALRMAYAARGLNDAAMPFQQAWDAVQREHILFRDRLHRSALIPGGEAPARALKKCLSEFSELPLPSAIRRGNRMQTAREAYERQIDETRRNFGVEAIRDGLLEQLEEAFARLRFLVDDLIDELKTRR